jgi:hypothetical protein
MLRAAVFDNSTFDYVRLTPETSATISGQVFLFLVFCSDGKEDRCVSLLLRTCSNSTGAPASRDVKAQRRVPKAMPVNPDDGGTATAALAFQSRSNQVSSHSLLETGIFAA